MYRNASLQSLACTWASAGFTGCHTTGRFCSFSERCCSPQASITRIPSQEALHLSSRKVPSFPSHKDASIAFNEVWESRRYNIRNCKEALAIYCSQTNLSTCRCHPHPSFLDLPSLGCLDLWFPNKFNFIFISGTE